jgi:hypothetical protein
MGVRFPSPALVVPRLARWYDERPITGDACLALLLLVTLGTVHHHRRTGGSAAGSRRLVLATVAATLVLTAIASAMVA